MENGHIFWLAPGEKKASVHWFIKHVGDEWRRSSVTRKQGRLADHRQGHPDAYYFFLQLFDVSRKDYVKDPAYEGIP